MATEPTVWLPDVNVLLALHVADHVHHAAARIWMEGIESYATTPVTESGLVRLLLNPTITGQSVSSTFAFTALTTLRSNRRAAFWADDTSLAQPRFNVDGMAGYRQTTDYHLLNVAARHGGRLATLDSKIERTLTAADRYLVETIDTTPA